ncbi:MAG: hypothetical protein GY941_14075 [Planctomycetes bacterium]|nr:hypothetical protein [Planctomycetota bacterium]
MTDIKHTPWTIEYEDYGETFIVDAAGDVVTQVDDDITVDLPTLEQAKSIIKACNSYYESQEKISQLSQDKEGMAWTIKELVEVLEDCAEYSSLSEEYRPIPNTERDLMVDIESAIAKAKAGSTDR